MRMRTVAAVGILASWGAICPEAGAQGAGGQTLEDVQGRIQALQQRLTRQQGELDAGQLALRDQERTIADGARELAEISANLESQRQQADSLRDDAIASQERLTGERRTLAEQVRTAYLSGKREALKLLLNQESAALLGRLLVYYDYLNRARSLRIADVSLELESRERLVAESEQAVSRLGALEQAHAGELVGLASARDERQLVLDRLEQDIFSADSEIQRLLDQQQRLTEVVREVDAAVAEIPIIPPVDFRGARGQLSWPVQGSLINDYGESRVDGQLRWRGIMVGAARGSAVHTVHGGRIVFADWLPGLGLLVIVDHGMGFMSLYGHNEAILTETGTTVASGQTIARVGDSGGQRQSALYFEIRQNGDPVDPRPWMSARLSR